MEQSWDLNPQTRIYFYRNMWKIFSEHISTMYHRMLSLLPPVKASCRSSPNSCPQVIGQGELFNFRDGLSKGKGTGT